ncbi:sulfurtransferase TusA family protein [Anaerosoma tenue]|uniref:sulfurtransferase TusA family protein n=1 Tax=Anaerosoma tenue TaxID=2933588 RepID=UPI002260CCEA|nr:sulfurtransferase TusA family protein [Anaerosoma tenue]MCK8115033.1 sulfurtransferase TusA family protein [Anaerosoma tenue]
MKEVDVRGLSCPMPLMHTKKAIEDDPTEILVHADSGTAKANVVAFLQDAGYSVSVDQTGEEYKIKGAR